jgi:hypothetical protein
MCWDAPPPSYSGPGDAHSNREWIWRRTEYEAHFQEAPEGALRLESTPFYLYHPVQDAGLPRSFRTQS